ncbi:MAG: hypothetical protein ABSG68_11415 [Thermoguttaceae bacterium]|jgi:hypothetical protein
MPQIFPSDDEAFPEIVDSPIVEIKQHWGDPWTLQADFEALRWSVCCATHDLDRCEIRHRYGYLKHPWESDFSQHDPISLGSVAGWWVRVSAGGTPLWIGKISKEHREVHGASATGPSGIQTFTAYGPLQILRKIFVGESYWLVDSTRTKIGWNPGVNTGHELHLADRGNMSDGTEAPDYLYGTGAEWTNDKYVTYLLNNFADESDDGGPGWQLSGDTSLLALLSPTLQFQPTESLADMLFQLIPRQYGLDFVILTDGTNFFVEVFTLNTVNITFGGTTIPANMDTVSMDLTGSPDVVACRLEESNDHGYKTARVLGQRIVVCATLAAVNNDTGGLTAGTLVPAWSSDDQAAYMAGTGTPDDYAELHDAARAAMGKLDVFRCFAASAAYSAQPLFDAHGNFVSGSSDTSQRQVRHTLEWTPLQSGFDYSHDPPVDNNASGVVPKLLPPRAWVYTPIQYVEGVSLFQEVNDLQVHLAAAPGCLGVRLDGSPQHVLASNEFSTAAAPSLVYPLADWRTLAVTLAFRSDQRIKFELALPGALPSDGVYEHEVPDAECWVLAPHTIVDATSGGDFTISPSTAVVLRNDSQKLVLAMAGVVARYLSARCRADITVKGLYPWAQYVGCVLDVVVEGDTSDNLAAPITAIEYTAPDNTSPTTTLRAGYASAASALLAGEHMRRRRR